MDAVQLTLICVVDRAVANRLPGADGAGAAPAALKATTCITHEPAAANCAVAWNVPVAVTTSSSAISPSGLVITREVYPVPGADVLVETVLAPTNKSFAFVVVMAPLSVVELLPVAAPATSRGLLMSDPLYSRMRISG